MPEKEVDDTSFTTIEQLDDLSDYEVSVVAVDSSGNVSGPSNSITLTTLDGTPPVRPGNLSTSNVTDSSMAVSWDSSTDNDRVASYDVYLDGQHYGEVPAETTSMTIQGLDDATIYTIGVSATDRTGNESDPREIDVRTDDTTAPSIPENLSSPSKTDTSVALSWDSSTDNTGIDHYSIYVDGTHQKNVTSTSGVVGGLDDFVEYMFHITATDPAGNESGSSNSLTVRTEDSTPPTTPSNLRASSKTPSSVDLVWDSASDNDGISYRNIYMDGDLIKEVSGTSGTVSGLSEITQYKFTVTAVDNSGNESASSNLIRVTTADGTAPTAPSNLRDTNKTGTMIDLSWDGSTDNVGVESYNVYVDGAQSMNVASTSTTIDGLSVATTYQLEVTALDGAGNESAKSPSISVTTDDTIAPKPPSNLSVNGSTTTSVDLIWDPATDNDTLDHYDIYMDGSQLMEVSGTTTSATISNLLPANNYSFIVTGTDTNSNESANSNETTGTTKLSSSEVEMGESITVAPDVSTEGISPLEIGGRLDIGGRVDVQ